MIGNCLALVVWHEDTDLSLTTIIASAVTTIIRRPNTPIKAMDITLSPLSIYRKTEKQELVSIYRTWLI